MTDQQSRLYAILFTGLLIWVLCGLVAAFVGDRRGRLRAGFVCGLFLGPLGILAALFLQKDQKQLAATAGPVKRRPGEPVKRVRMMPIQQDPLEAWEAQERAKKMNKE